MEMNPPAAPFIKPWRWKERSGSWERVNGIFTRTCPTKNNLPEKRYRGTFATTRCQHLGIRPYTVTDRIEGLNLQAFRSPLRVLQPSYIGSVGNSVEPTTPPSVVRHMVPIPQQDGLRIPAAYLTDFQREEKTPNQFYRAEPHI
jgi:hypothetical protein